MIGCADHSLVNKSWFCNNGGENLLTESLLLCKFLCLYLQICSECVLDLEQIWDNVSCDPPYIIDHLLVLNALGHAIHPAMFSQAQLLRMLQVNQECNCYIPGYDLQCVHFITLSSHIASKYDTCCHFILYWKAFM